MKPRVTARRMKEWLNGNPPQSGTDYMAAEILDLRKRLARALWAERKESQAFARDHNGLPQNNEQEFMTKERTELASRRGKKT